MAVELLSRTMFGISEEKKRGFFFIVFDPSVFGNEVFAEEVTQLVRKMQGLRKAPGVDEIVVPGERGERLKKERLKEGWLDLHEQVVDELRSL